MSYRSTPAFAIGAVGLHDRMAASHPKLSRGQVWCRKCRRTENVSAAHCLRSGWPKCCGQTMTIDPPEEWGR